jgi:DNA-binding NtrC family response regulator
MTDKILIADDDSFMLTITNTIIQSKFPEIQVESFEDGTSLEKRLNAGIDGVKLVITDNNMPGIGGRFIIQKYARKPEYSRVKFVLCSGAADSFRQELEKEVMENGAFGYIPKPSKIDVYVDIVKRALEA